ncbi:MAG: chromosome segregation protein SMC [Euryarchaeota archaeon]|nr:chromosome segregation protein SMC [Euryarchaeota archaeon]
MHLTRIELENFKSFGTKLTIPFLPGFTGVTGPNGSGKSNIGDAVLFVLGPKSSKAIRAGKLTDLIFNGGKDRKSGPDFCKVSLVFDNADRTMPIEANEVSLTRMVRRSKTSKEDYYSYFYINGRTSSLTEFDNLLAYARISAEGYNLVQQGDVTRIVNMSPLERRRVLDDIAGITKFDEEIEKADKRKAEVEANLERIGIILNELNQQLAALEKDRAAAERYATLKKDFDVTRAKYAKRRKDNFEAELVRLKAEIENFTTQKTQLEGEKTCLQDEIAEADKKFNEVQSKLSERGGEELREVQEAANELRVEVQVTKEKMNHSKLELAELKKSRSTVKGDLDKAMREIARLEKDIGNLEKERGTALERIESTDSELASVKDLVSRSNSKSGDLQRELSQLKVDWEAKNAELMKVKGEAQLLSEKIARLEQDLAVLEEAEKNTEFELKDIDFSLRETQKEAKTVGKGADELKSKMFSLKKDESEFTKQLNELEPAIRRLRNEYQDLKAAKNAAEAVTKGYVPAVDRVLEARDTGELKGICGTIAELGRADSKYDMALEIAAGGRMQAVVTESDEDAARAIAYLKKNNMGRATFLPLNKMLPGRPQGKPLMAVRDAGAEGFAIDLLRYDERFKSAFWYVFKDTVIVKNIDHARRLMGGVRLVTLDGDLIDSAGAMSGGSTPKTDRLKFGAPSKDALDKVTKSLQAAIAQQEVVTSQLAEIRDELGRIESDLRNISLTGVTSDSRVQDLEGRRKEFASKLDLVKRDQERVQGEIKATKDAAEKLASRLAKAEASVAKLDADREERGKLLLKSTVKELADKLTVLQDEVTKLRQEEHALTSKIETGKTNLSLVSVRRDELAGNVERVDASMGEHEKTVKECEKSIQEKAEKLTVIAKVEEEKTKAFSGLTKARDEAHDRVAALNAGLDKLVDKLNSTSDLITTKQSEIPHVEAELTEVTAELGQYAAVEIPATIEETLETLKAKIRRIENELNSFQGVNLRALEQFDAETKRKGELEAEVSRLQEQKTNLVALVEEITAKKKDGLMIVFAEVNKNFTEVFAGLSDGGKAELLLENPERPFEAGLIIRAQPKGKRVTRLEALSGGEKSLTALGLIFAIQQYQPSPFYMLDEVDMFLDGVNAELVARMVKTNSVRAQFIMVSLRKCTLQQADHVYGVTMTASGLSQVIGEVKVSELSDEPERSATEEPLVKVKRARSRSGKRVVDAPTVHAEEVAPVEGPKVEIAAPTPDPGVNP